MTTTEPPERLIVLCAHLADATRAGEAKWRTDAEDTYVWERDEGTVAIGARDRDGQPPYEITVFNSEREKVDELASALVENDEPAPWNAPLADLYRAARRSALHADEIIDMLIAALPSRASAVRGDER